MKDKVKQLHNEGMWNGDIAKELNISRQRVHQIVTGYRSFSQSFSKKLWKSIKNPKTCRDCKKTAIAIHHLDGESRNNEVDNLLPVCLECHVKRHLNKNYSSSIIEKVEILCKEGKWISDISKETNLSKGIVRNIIKKFDIFYNPSYPFDKIGTV